MDWHPTSVPLTQLTIFGRQEVFWSCTQKNNNNKKCYFRFKVVPRPHYSLPSPKRLNLNLLMCIPSVSPPNPEYNDLVDYKDLCSPL